MTIFQTLTNQQNIKDVVKEMEKRYLNSYLSFKDTYIRYRGYNPDSHTFHFSDVHNENLVVFLEKSEDEIKIPNPRRGFYNIAKGVIYMYRNPYRQWRRGINSETTVMLRLSSLYPNNGFIHPNEFSPINVSYLVDTPDTKLREALKECTSFGSYALTKTFAISYHFVNPSGYMLWFNSFVIGEIQENRITIKHPYFIQEVRDASTLWENFEVCYDPIN